MGDEHIWELGFPAWREVTGRSSVADLFKPKERCGIYILGFADGERYVGQAVNVVSRFGQHLKRHGDITHLTFRAVKKAELDEGERHCIHTLESRGLKLRNIAHMSVVTGERDLDLVVTPDEQEKWLAGQVAESEDAPTRVQDADLRRRYQRRFEEFGRQPHSEDAIFLLGLYLQAVVPFPKRTELSFWAVSCLPEYRMQEGRLLFRVNLNMQEVFTVIAYQGGLSASFHLAQSPFEAAFGSNWPEKLSELGWEFDDHAYAPAGHDQFNLHADGFGNIAKLMLLAPFADAMRLVNLRLMRKGPTYYSKFHGLDLADAAFEAFERRLSEVLTDFENGSGPFADEIE
ncbi:GIY-YIG nuclease family protein [Deinococcus wulumuqiensis]|uniref:GIY-YIG nuclease family protein n=1 Tax=Deinococcus wulumuqiensis TaxID=980427 RepID=UPI00243159E1|nr:GIY-YIG nuclease family protein [Deinococcus wulumuqiensis]